MKIRSFPLPVPRREGGGRSVPYFCLMAAWNDLVSRFTRIDLLYLVGLLLAVGGCNGVFLFEGAMVWASLPLYLIGLALVWLSGTNAFNRMLALLLPAVAFISLYTVTSDDRVREPAVWLVPEGHSGPLRMFLKEKCGVEETREETFRLYAVDSSGIGYSAMGKNFGVDLEPSRFHWVKSDGRRIPLRNFQEPADTLIPAVTDTNGAVIYGFPDRFVSLETNEGKCHVDLAFVGTYRQYLDHIRSTVASDTLEAGLQEQRRAWLETHCRKDRGR